VKRGTKGDWYAVTRSGRVVAAVPGEFPRARATAIAQAVADSLGVQVLVLGARDPAHAKSRARAWFSAHSNPSRTATAKAKRRAARTHRTGGRKLQRARARYQAGKSSDAQLHHTLKRTYARRITRAGSFVPGDDRRNPIPRGIDRRSVRTVKRGRSRVLVGCPTGHWHPRAKGRKCDVAMRAFEVKRNPAAEIEQAARTFKRWHEFDPRGIAHVKGPRAIPKTLVMLGTVPRFTYVSNKWEGRQVTYEHRTKRPHPLLCTGPDGRGLFIVGGRTRVTARGLVD